MTNFINPGMINEVMNCSKSEQNELYVGLCGTQFVGSDRYACVITEIITPKSVRVSWMRHNDYESNRKIDDNGNEFIEDMSNYVCPNDEGTKMVPTGKIFKFRKNKRWIEQGHDLWSTGAVHFGKADEYRDPCF